MNLATTGNLLPTLAAIERRRRQLLSLRSWQPEELLFETLDGFEQPGPATAKSRKRTRKTHQPWPTQLYSASLTTPSATSRHTLKPTPSPSSSNSSPPLATSSPHPARPGRLHLSNLFAEVDPNWAVHRVSTTPPTPARIIQSLRDQPPNPCSTVNDRRFFHLLGRKSGQLSPLLRCAWDGGDLCASNGHHTVKATAAHISVVGHITQSELAQHLSRNNSHNGFANRCLWASVRRSQSLPEVGCLPPIDPPLWSAS